MIEMCLVLKKLRRARKFCRHTAPQTFHRLHACGLMILVCSQGKGKFGPAFQHEDDCREGPCFYCESDEHATHECPKKMQSGQSIWFQKAQKMFESRQQKNDVNAMPRQQHAAGEEKLVITSNSERETSGAQVIE
jgi:hypothetical protein